MSVEPHSFDAASTSPVRLNDAHLGGTDGRAAVRPVASRRRKFRRLRQSSGWNLELKRRTCCPKQQSLEETLAHEASSSVDQESQKNTEATWDHYLPSPHIARHTALHGSRLLNGHANLWKTTRRSYGIFECEFGYLGMFMNTTLRAAGHLGKAYDTNLRFVKNHLRKTTGQHFTESEAG